MSGDGTERCREKHGDSASATVVRAEGDLGVERLIVLGKTYTECLEAAGLGRVLRAAIPSGD
jgi:hypothetical protein